MLASLPSPFVLG